MQKDNLAEYSKEQFEVALGEIYTEITDGKTVDRSPEALILGGQPGAGKSTMQKIALDRNHNTIVINGDEYRRNHPNFVQLSETFGKDSVLHTQKFCGQMTEALIQKLSDGHYNLIIEGTLRTAEVPLKTCELLKGKGYTTELAVMAVDKALSWQGTLNRYNAMVEQGRTPRATPKEHHDKVAEAIPDNLSAIYEAQKFDKIPLYNRSGECLYDSTVNHFNPKQTIYEAINPDTSRDLSAEYDEVEFVIERQIGGTFTVEADGVTKEYSLAEREKTIAALAKDFGVERDGAETLLSEAQGQSAVDNELAKLPERAVQSENITQAVGLNNETETYNQKH